MATLAKELLKDKGLTLEGWADEHLFSVASTYLVARRGWAVITKGAKSLKIAESLAKTCGVTLVEMFGEKPEKVNQ